MRIRIPTLLLLTTLIPLNSLYTQSTQEDATARFNRAFELQKKGAWKEAEEEYRAVLAVAPDYAEAYSNLGAVLMRLDRYEEAVRAYETALKLSPKLTPVLLNLGIAHYRKSEFVRAIDAFKRFLDASPGNAQATQLTALSLVELRRDEEALEYLDPALLASPKDPTLLYATGLVCLRTDKPYVNGIIKTLSEADGGVPFSHLLRGQQLLKHYEFEKAVEELNAAAKLNPDLPRLQYSLGLCYFKLGRTKEATAAFEAELVRSPKDFSTLYYTAYFREESGDIADAHGKINLALALEPDSPEGNALLGKILFKEGKAQEALKPLEVAVAKSPEDADMRYLLARVYMQAGRREDAAREFNESKRLREVQLEKDREKTLKPNN